LKGVQKHKLLKGKNRRAAVGIAAVFCRKHTFIEEIEKVER
jgi:hypothetical protein